MQPRFSVLSLGCLSVWCNGSFELNFFVQSHKNLILPFLGHPLIFCLGLTQASGSDRGTKSSGLGSLVRAFGLTQPRQNTRDESLKSGDGKHKEGSTVFELHVEETWRNFYRLRLEEPFICGNTSKKYNRHSTTPEVRTSGSNNL